MARKSKKMTDDELKAIVTTEVTQAVGNIANRLTEERRRAMQYFYGLPYGNEMDGYSAAMTTEVRDTILSMLPSFMRTFVGSEQVVEFEPEMPFDEAYVAQATDYCTHIFTKDNNALTVVYSLVFDALLSKLGVTKVFWEEKQDVRTSRYFGLYDPQYVALAQADDVEIVEHDEYEGQYGVVDPATGQETMQPVTQHDVVLRRTKKVGRAKCSPVPPEQFFYSRRATSDEDAVLMGDWTLLTASDLVAEGYARDLVDTLPSYSAEMWNMEREERFLFDDDGSELDDDSNDRSTRQIWVGDCYIRVDFDGDGIAELRRVRCAGNPSGFEILDNDPWDSRPYATATPIPVTHKLVGLSVADLTMDLQLQKSTFLRQWFDNMYRVNNGRAAISDKVNLDDYLNPVPGGPVRMLGGAMPEGHIVPLVTESLGQQCIEALNYIDSVLESRAGIYQNNVGFDPNSLNKTATAANLTSNNSQLRQELIARVIAETGLRTIFKKILELICKHQQEPRLIRLNGKFVQMDPRSWNDQMQATMNVGLGTNNKDQTLQHLMMIKQTQEQILTTLGPVNPLVTLDQYFTTLRKIVENSGFRSAEQFFTDPTKSQVPVKPPNDPHAGAQITAQADVQKEQMRIAAEPHIEALKAGADTTRAVAVAKIKAISDIVAAMITAKSDLNIAHLQAAMDGIESTMDRMTTIAQPDPQPMAAQPAGVP